MTEFFINQVFDGNLLLAIFVSAVAGLISFVSPCVIPLVPGYLSYISGLAADSTSSMAAKVGINRVKLLLATGLFIAGFTFLFISYGLAFGGLGAKIAGYERTLSIILGLLMIFFGIVFMKSQRFYRSFKVSWKVPSGLIGAPLLGFAFGLGWTPCIGPTLGAVQVLAFQSATATRGAILSAAYCFGLGIPFLLLAWSLDKTKSFRNWIARKGNRISQIGGIFLIVIGLLQLFNLWNYVMNWFRDLATNFIPVL
jgi:cytochrome c-type biogenesis protein